MRRIEVVDDQRTRHATGPELNIEIAERGRVCLQGHCRDQAHDHRQRPLAETSHAEDVIVNT